MLSKAKSILQLITRRSTSGSEHGTRHELLDQRGSRQVAAEATNLARIGGGSSDPEHAEAINSAWSQGSVAEDILIPDFQVETSPEDYFNDHRGEQARGTFHEIEVVRWNHDEADWSIAELEFEPPAKPPTQKEVRSSAIRVRKFASERSWLSPKSIRALAKLGDREPKLDRSETNALNYLLERCANVSVLTHDAEILRKVVSG